MVSICVLSNVKKNDFIISSSTMAFVDFLVPFYQDKKILFILGI